MKRDSKTLKNIALLLFVVIIGLVLISGTYAKYTSTVSGTDTATVAKFSVSSNINSASFDLFSTKEVDGSSTENDVLADRIAPGTGGSFKVSVANDSEVKVAYTLAISETSNTSKIPIEYSVDGTNYATAENFSKLTNASGELAIGSTTQQTKEITIYWRWAFEGTGSTNYKSSQTDTTDTTLGTATTAPTVEVTASATFTQVD